MIQQAVTPVNPGDFITADIDGMACCPRELVQRVLEVIPTIFAADRKCMEAIKAGMSIEDAFAKFRGWSVYLRLFHDEKTSLFVLAMGIYKSLPWVAKTWNSGCIPSDIVLEAALVS